MTPLQIREVLHSAWRRGRGRFVAALSYSLLFKVLSALLISPLAAGALRLLLARTGRVSAGNFEIAAFLLSPAGIIALLSIGGIQLAATYLELAGLMRLLANHRLRWWQALGGSSFRFPQLVALGVWQLMWFLILAAPFLAGIGLVYWLLWSGRDLNGLIVLKPREFWIGVGLAGALAAVYAVLALRLFFRWLLAVPTLLFEPGVRVLQALSLSTKRMQPRLTKAACLVAIWGAVLVLVWVLVMGVLRFGSGWVLGQVGSSMAVALGATAIVLVINVAVATALGILGSLTFAALVLVLHEHAAGPIQSAEEMLAAENGRSPTSPAWILAGVLLAVGAVAIPFSYWLLGSLQLNDQLEITAHRAGAAHAPENTVAALKRAIDDRADWAEIDVQLTADKQLVIMHDIDLARVGGGKKRVDQATLAEIRALDVGALFDPQFAGERIPTFAEILAAAGSRIRLNVELKPHGKSDVEELTRRVVAEIQQAGIADQCRLCSQSYEGIRLGKQLEPRLAIGYIVATSLGDVTLLEIDFLMIKGSLATGDLAERAALQKIAVHAWTVNDPAQVGPLLDAGVANIITDDPALIRARLDEIRALGPVERLLLRARSALEL